ncbi:MAG: acyloxyacyl hydrolase [Alphaproteobacteria bacterium]|nr:acyloxyacyl hydrolase [Alphaproteobacteria bacterium]
MKKITTFLIALSCISAANAEFNPFMGEAENQIAFYIGQGVDNGYIVPLPYHPVPFYIAQFQYSQPTTFFKMPARQSLNVAETLGLGKKYGWDWTDFTIPLVLGSGDVALFYGDNWYTGVGAGVGLQAQQNERLGAKLLFEFKLFYGYRINEEWGIELYAQHFSNANTAEENHSYAFFGIGVNHNF